MKKKAHPDKTTAGRRTTDYPQFTFRISNDKKNELSKDIDSLTEMYNKTKGPGDYVVRKNDVIIEALELGLKALEIKLSKMLK